MQQLFLDDFKPGDVYPSTSHTLNDFHYAMFAAITGDSTPLHEDVEYAKARGWEGRVAHGLLLLSMCAVGSAPISHALKDSVVAMMGSEARFKRPAYIGDTMYPEFTVLAIEPKDEKRGILKLKISLYNQRREVVLEGVHAIMLKRHTATAA